MSMEREFYTGGECPVAVFSDIRFSESGRVISGPRQLPLWTRVIRRVSELAVATA